MSVASLNVYLERRVDEADHKVELLMLEHHLVSLSVLLQLLAKSQPSLLNNKQKYIIILSRKSDDYEKKMRISGVK